MMEKLGMLSLWGKESFPHMILFKLILKIVRIVLLILLFASIVLIVVPFALSAASYASQGVAFNDFFSLFTEALGQYCYGSLATDQRTVGVILTLVGFLGGVLFNILSIFFKKARWPEMGFGIVAIVGAIIVYPTLDQAAMVAFNDGDRNIYNYIVIGLLSYSLTFTIMGLYHLCSGLRRGLD